MFTTLGATRFATALIVCGLGIKQLVFGKNTGSSTERRAVIWERKIVVRNLYCCHMLKPPILALQIRGKLT